MDFIVNYILAAIVFVVIDSLWIGIIANKFYKKHMKKLLLDKPRLGPAALFYALYIFGLVYFVLDPVTDNGRPFWRMVRCSDWSCMQLMI